MANLASWSNIDSAFLVASVSAESGDASLAIAPSVIELELDTSDHGEKDRWVGSCVERLFLPRDVLDTSLSDSAAVGPVFSVSSCPDACYYINIGGCEVLDKRTKLPALLDEFS